MTTWTTPRTWTIGETVTKSIMDTHVRDNLNYLKEQGAVRSLPVQQAIPPLSGVQAAGLQLIESSGAGTAKPVIFELGFDDTTDEGRMWIFKLDGAPGATVSVNIGYYMKSANVTKKVKFSAQLAALSSGDTGSTAKVFAAASTVNPTVPDAVGTKSGTTLVIANVDSLAQGDWVCLFLQRVPSDTTNDTATGDCAVVDIQLSYG